MARSPHRVALFFLPPALGGGSTSYTAHLYAGMAAAGFNPIIHRVKARGEYRKRQFGKYDGVYYQNVIADEAVKIVKKMPTIITAPAHSKHLRHAPDLIARLMKAGSRLVIHDPNEFKVFDHLGALPHNVTPFCIRPTMRKFFEKAIYIPHPYMRQLSDWTAWPSDKRPHHAVSIARISFVKRTVLILDANRLLPKSKRVVLRGAENRLYTRHVITKQFPEFTQGGYGFPMTFAAAPLECADATFAIDMTWFPNDGGGSQYSFMEAWDAGTVNIIHEDWLRYKGEMSERYTCISVGGASELALALKQPEQFDLQRYAATGYRALKAHDAEMIARQYMEHMK